ncbi:hypothetical protein Mspyr1_12020 [Mycolicibacterium gilvum Spyr1]|uniref:Helix-turn-helix domain-containing protein n=1 Tax=Mycolicibacterium gilvum (strain DSM 45189 / LMG 24558 / Spyr1) TaxID=278137 RepID=E6TH03_MYCSR|nr:hypothetical protein Mspyr1_12020 [Mycolicibacterium gilvum Spyr1]
MTGVEGAGQKQAGPTLNLSPDEVRAALFAVDYTRRQCERLRYQEPDALAALHHRLATAHTSRVAESTFHSGAVDLGESEAWIGTGQAAQLLGCSTRAVWRRRHSLDAHQLNGRWWYPAATIQDMKRHKERAPHDPT